jgi:hypothetical protein
MTRTANVRTKVSVGRFFTDIPLSLPLELDDYFLDRAGESEQQLLHVATSVRI